MSPQSPSVQIDDLLSLMRRRSSPEERARVEWWRRRIALLAEQEPEALPVEPEAAVAAGTEVRR